MSGYTQTFKYTPLIPANAGIQNACCLMPWAPAFAGVSGEMDGACTLSNSLKTRKTVSN